MSRKLNTEIVRKDVESIGFRLIGEYVQKQKITIECLRGHKDEIWVHRLKHKDGCNRCKKIEYALNIKTEIESQGYILHNTYEDIQTVLIMTCPNGHKRVCKIDSFRRYNCEQCESDGHMKDLITRINSLGYKIISIPENTHGQLEAICKNGHYRKAKIFNFINHNCSFCNEHRNYEYTYEDVLKIFNEKNFILLSDTYINCKQKLDYICSCGRKSETTLDQLVNSDKYCCDECKSIYISEKVKGESHWNWQGGITSVKSYLRSQINEWKKKTMFNCDYKCMITLKDFTDIHHLYSFNLLYNELVRIIDFKIHEKVEFHTEEELRTLKDIIIDLHNKYGLGICLNYEVHNHFHDIYGRGDNDVQQFITFVEDFYPSELDRIEEYVNKFSY